MLSFMGVILDPNKIILSINARARCYSAARFATTIVLISAIDCENTGYGF